MWTVEECEKCGGSGWDYCHECETPCDHDKLCSACKGHKVTDPFQLMVLASANHYIWGPWRTRREAFATIEYDSLA